MMIEIQHATVHYNNKKLIEDINLKINKGTCLLLCGESGSGKTTITKLINGLIPYFSDGLQFEGSVNINGKNTNDVKIYEIAQDVSSVFQNPKSQFFHTDTDSEIVFGLENAGVCPEKIRKKYDETIESLKLHELKSKNIFSLSAGEKQLLAFASVYAMDSDIFVLDEPSSNLDAETIQNIKQILTVLKNKSKTIIIAEHRMYYVMDIIDYAVHIKSGKINKIFTKDEFSSLPEQERLRLGLRSFHIKNLTQKESVFNETDDFTVKDLSFTYKNKTVLENINVSGNFGEVLGIIGKNGRGKTTLINIICGLLKQASGVVKLNGKKLSIKERNKHAFCVMQDVNHQLFYESVAAECENVVDTVNVLAIDALLTGLNLAAWKDAHPMSLSGGQKQRLAVALAILSKKDIIVFDEPTSGLDYNAMVQVSTVIRDLKQKKKIIIIISHDYEFLELVSDRIKEI